MNVFVSGYGIISPLGFDANENLHRLRKGLSGIRKAKYFDSKYAGILPFGEVDISTGELKKQIEIKNRKGLTRTCMLAIKAFNEAVLHAGLSEKEISSPDTSFISASTVGGMCMTDQLYKNANLKSDETEFAQSYSCSAHTIRIIDEFKIKGFSNTINTACSSSANAIMMGARLIKSKRAKRAIVGGVDSLAKYTVNGFNSLRILSESACKPFDKFRTGLTLGEGAAFLVLESEEIVGKKPCYAKIAGYGNASDAYHASTMSDNAKGVVQSVSQALDSAGMKPIEIDFINAHGTGTLNNDFTEIVAFSKVFGKVPLFMSTKSYTGHTLGAAGVIEAVYSIYNIMHNEIYPQLNFKTEIPEFGLKPVTNYRQGLSINNVLSNSYGFNGNCTSLIFSKDVC